MARGIGIFVSQTFLEAAEQQSVSAVLLVLAAVEVALNLKAPMYHKGVTHHGELEPCHMKLTGLQGNGLKFKISVFQHLKCITITAYYSIL